MAYLAQIAPRVGVDLSLSEAPLDRKSGSTNPRSTNELVVRQLDDSTTLPVFQMVEDLDFLADDDLLLVAQLSRQPGKNSCDMCGDVNHFLMACPRLRQLRGQTGAIRRLFRTLRAMNDNSLSPTSRPSSSTNTRTRDRDQTPPRANRPLNH